MAVNGTKKPNLVAYLADPSAVHATTALLDQKRLIEGAAWMLNARVSRWCVDSGRRFPGQRCGDAMLRLLGELGEGDTVVVAEMPVLAFDGEAVAAIAGTLAFLGVAVAVARDVLHGSPATAVPDAIAAPDVVSTMSPVGMRLAAVA